MLVYGIIGALLFRALFIALGSVLMQYWLLVTVFGLVLIATGIKMLRAPDHKVDPERNLLIRLFRRWMPVTSDFHGQQFFAIIFTLLTVAIVASWLKPHTSTRSVPVAPQESR